MHEVQPPTPLGLEPSFGFGDRLGLATPGHLEALRAQGGPILPIFAQQSTRELERTGRKPADVIKDAADALQTARYNGRWGADADHMKTQEDVNSTASVGFTMFTIDPSEHLDARADTCSLEQLDELYREVRADVNWPDEYLGRRVRLEGDTVIDFQIPLVRRVAVKYGRAIAHSIKLAAHIDRVMAKREGDFEIELSVDETPHPTTLAEHFIIAEQILRSDVKMVSLAPRLIGDFEKAVDYKGDLPTLQKWLADHAAIARKLGPYKLSLHSGSDKFSIYESFARATGGMFHVKTAGTSYLEALRVASRHERKLFRRIVAFSRKRFEKDRATYNISARLDSVPDPAAVGDDATLERMYLDQDNGRQILHVTFGSVLTDSALGPALRDVLVAEPKTHCQVIARHFGKHLQALCSGL